VFACFEACHIEYVGILDFLWIYHISCLSRLSIVLLCAPICVLCLDIQICKAKDCFCSVDTHFQNATESMSLLLLPMNGASIASMDVCNQSKV